MPDEVFEYTGEPETYDVSDAFFVEVELQGARGADGEDGENDGGSGGDGAYVTGELDVQDFDEIRIYVGGSGSGSRWGFYEGAAGGDGQNAGDDGAGETSIRDPNDNLLVSAAGGAGGAGGFSGTTTSTGGGGGGAPGGSGGAGEYDGDDGDDADGDGEGGDGGDAAGGDGGSGGADYDEALFEVDEAESGGSETGGNGEISVEVSLEEVFPPEDLAIDDERETEIDLTWTDDDEAESVHIYRDTGPGIEQAEGNHIATVDVGEEEFTDTGLDNVTTYYYAVSSGYRDEETDLSDEVDGTTTLPDVSEITAEPEAVGELEVGWATPQNAGQVRVETKRDADSDWGLVGEFDLETTSTTVDGLFDGDLVDVRARSEANDTEGDWVEASEITLFPPLNLEFPHVNETSVEVAWDEIDNPDATYHLERAIATTGKTPRPDFGDFVTVDDDAEPAVLDEGLESQRQHRYRLTAITPYDETGETRTTQTDFRYSDNYTLELIFEAETDNDEADVTASVPIYSRDIIDSPRWRRELSADARWRLSIPWSPGAEEWRFSEAIIWFAGRPLLRGELTKIESTDSAGETVLEGLDILKWLQEDGAAYRYTNTEVTDALADYVDENLEDWTVLIAEPEDQPVDEDLVLYDAVDTDAFEALFEIADETPVGIGDNAERLQTCWYWEGTDNRSRDGVATYSGDEVSDGSALQFNEEGDNATWIDQAVGHTIPEEHVGIGLRWTAGPDSDDVPDLELTLREFDTDDEIGTVVISDFQTDFEPTWDFDDTPFGTPWEDGDIEPGDVYWDVTGINQGEALADGVRVDLIALFDRRWVDDDDFENELHEPGGYIEAPGTHEGGVEITSDAVDAVFNVDQAILETDIDGTDGEQRLQVANNGEDFYPDDGSEDNTDSVDVDFREEDTFGTDVYARVRLDGHSPDGPQDATPRFNYAPQTIDELEIRVWTSDIPVIDDLEGAENHKRNLKDIADEGGFGLTPIYHPDEEILLITPPGTWTPDDLREALEDAVGEEVANEIAIPTEWRTLDHSREVDVEEYANEVTVAGYDEDEDEWVEVTVTSDAEVERVGKTVPYWADPEPDISDPERLQNIARKELRDRVVRDQLAGSEDIVPTPLVPGIAYEVDVLDGASVPLWGNEFDDGRSPAASNEWVEPDDIASALAEQSDELRRRRY